MSHRVTHVCDSCGAEREMQEEPAVGSMSPFGWIEGGQLCLYSAIPGAIFDLCKTCTARVVDLLGLKIEKARGRSVHLRALSGGLTAGGLLRPDLCPLPSAAALASSEPSAEERGPSTATDWQPGCACGAWRSKDCTCGGAPDPRR